MTYLIAGAGPAGLRAAEALRSADAAGDILLLHPEGGVPYSRIALPDYMTGALDDDGIACVPASFLENNRIRVLERSLARLLSAEHTAILDDGSHITYDRLLLATGAEPLLPPFARPLPANAATLWTRADARRVRALLPGVRRAVVIGGGLVGLHAAQALAENGREVTVAEMLPDILAAQLDDEARAMVTSAAEAAGVSVRTGTRVLALTPSQVETDGGVLPAELVIISTGVRARLSFLEDETAARSGLPVDDSMRTAYPDVWAAGDIARARDRFTGEACVRALWPCAVEQARIAGESMAGLDTRYAGSVPMNSLHLFGLPVISAGDFSKGEGCEIVRLRPAEGVYARLALRGGRLSGFLLAGRVQCAGALCAALGGEPPARLLQLLERG